MTSFAVKAPLQIGSWRAELSAECASHARWIQAYFRQVPGLYALGNLEAEIFLFRKRTRSSKLSLIENHYQVREESRVKRWTFSSDRLDVVIDESHVPVQIVAHAAGGERVSEAVAFALGTILRGWLLRRGKKFLHAGAIATRSGATLFVGESGSGKSTLSIRSAQAGATLLSDDHVLLSRVGKEFWVSGTSEWGRVTHRSKAYLFPAGLPRRMTQSAPRNKTSVQLSELLPCRALENVRVRRLIFPSVMASVARQPLRRLSPKSAALRIIQMTQGLYRFLQNEDPARFLDYVTSLTEVTESWQVALDADFSVLKRTIPFLLA